MLRAEDFRAAMASFATGVTIVTTLESDGSRQAMTATAFTSVSLEPPLCLVCLDRRARAYAPLLQHGSFGVSILAAEQESVAAQCAAPLRDRLAGLRWRPGARTGCPLLSAALAGLECQLVEAHPAGDHDILLGRVESVQLRDGKPLLYWRASYAALRASAAEHGQQAVERRVG